MSDRKTHIQATDDAIAAFLANGGVIQEIPPGKSGIPEGYSQNAWGRPKRKVEVEAEAEVEVETADDLSVPTIDSDLDADLDDTLVGELIEAVEVDHDLFSGIFIDGDGGDDELIDDLEE